MHTRLSGASVPRLLTCPSLQVAEAGGALTDAARSPAFASREYACRMDSPEVDTKAPLIPSLPANEQCLVLEAIRDLLGGMEGAARRSSLGPRTGGIGFEQGRARQTGCQQA